MKSLTTVSVAAILIAGAWTACAGADEPQSIDGTWEVRRFDKATDHEFAGLEIVLQSDGETLRGRAVWPDGKETPIAAGSIVGGRVSFKVTPGSVIQDYSGEFDGGVIRGRWAVGIAAFDWEARRQMDVSAEQLHGRWNFEHGALGEFDTLELQCDGRFRLEHRDVALGATTTFGTWALEGRDVVLREERHEVDGQEVRDRTPRTEKLRIRQTANGLRLGKPLREFQRESTNQEGASETTPAAKADDPQETTQQFTGVSDKRSLDEALGDALRQMDEAVAQEAKSPCSRVTWRVIDISGTSGTPAGLQTIQVRITASFEGQGREDLAAASPAGAWRVTRALGDGEFDGFTLVLWLDGEELDGVITWADGKEHGLGSGEFKNGQLSFKADNHYTGTFEGNTIAGKWSTDIGMLEWRAERILSLVGRCCAQGNVHPEDRPTIESLYKLGWKPLEKGNLGLGNNGRVVSLELYGPESVEVTDKWLRSLRDLPKLRALYLRRAKITDAGLAELTGLSDLWELSLSDTSISDEGLKHIAGLSNLRWLEVTGARVTRAGLNTLREKKPRLVIVGEPRGGRLSHEARKASNHRN